MLEKAYSGLSIGSPLDENNHVGPLIDKDAVNTMMEAIDKAKKDGGILVFGGEQLEGRRLHLWLLRKTSNY